MGFSVSKHTQKIYQIHLKTLRGFLHLQVQITVSMDAAAVLPDKSSQIWCQMKTHD